jgi:hypothetical protein
MRKTFDSADPRIGVSPALGLNDLSRRRGAGLWRQDRKAERLQIGAKLLDGVETETVNAGGASGHQVCFAVIDKQCFGRMGADDLKTGLVDGRFWLDLADIGGKNMMVEKVDPREVVFYVAHHLGRHIGKDCRFDSRGMKMLEPFEHRSVDPAPHIQVPPLEGVNRLRRKLHASLRREMAPVIDGSEIRPVVGSAAGVVNPPKAVRIQLENASHARDFFRRRRKAEDFAIIEDYGADRGGLIYGCGHV